MSAEDTWGELLGRLNDMHAVIKAVRRDVPFAGSRAGLSLLVALHESGELRIGELADVLEVDQSVASRHVSNLELLGLVERTPDPLDGRSRTVRLAPDGDRVARDHLTRVRHRLAAALDDWSDEEIADLSVLLARFRTSFDAHRARVPHLSRGTAQTVKGNR